MDLALLKDWCDALIALQITDKPQKELNGGILCPACARVHGRSGDAVYPFIALADFTGEQKYLDAAQRLFDWSENMTRPDGSYIGDTNAPWQGITVFAVIQLGEALCYHSHLLDDKTKRKWLNRLITAAEFLYTYIDTAVSNINYPITCASSMAIVWKTLDVLQENGRNITKEQYLSKSRSLARMAKDYFNQESLIFGEGHPWGYISPKGCQPIDIGYNVEESLPGLVTYALLTHDEEILALAQRSMKAHLAFFLPDGGWDNSWGSRSSKWTYWGSRTSDGCQMAYGLLADREPVFGEVCRRNTLMLRQCTHNGLLYGGPMYERAGEPPCVHHTFCHAKALAALLDHKVTLPAPVLLPWEGRDNLFHSRSTGTYVLSRGDWRATITEYDYRYESALEAHATGGTLTLLWHSSYGPVIAASTTEYELVEPNNMQVPQYWTNICQTPRIEREESGILYRSVHDLTACLRAEEDPTFKISADGILRNVQQEGSIPYHIVYTGGHDGFTITVDSGSAAVYHLPVVAAADQPYTLEQESGTYTAAIEQGQHTLIFTASQPIKIGAQQPTRVFHPVGGFQTIPFVFSLQPNQPLTVTFRYS